MKIIILLYIILITGIYIYNYIGKMILINKYNAKLIIKKKVHNTEMIIEEYYSFDNYLYKILIPYYLFKVSSYQDLKNIIESTFNKLNKMEVL